MDYAALMPDVGEQIRAYRQIGQALEQRGEVELARQAFEVGDRTWSSERDRMVRAGGIGLQRDRRSSYHASLTDLSPKFLSWVRGGDVSFGQLIAAAGDTLEEPERSVISSALTAYSNRLEAPEESFEALMQTISGAVNWTYPIGEAALVQDLAEIVVRAGWSDRIWQIADLAPEEMVRAWIQAQLAVGLVRAGENARATAAADQIIEMNDNDVFAGPAEPAGQHWLAVPALTAAAQALALAGEKKKTEEAVNQILKSTRATGFEMDKSDTLIAFAWVLLDKNRPRQAVEAAHLAMSTATMILDPFDRADVYDQLLPLLLNLGEQEASVHVAEQYLTLLDKYGGERMIANLVTITQILAATSAPSRLAAKIREYAEYEPLMHPEEVAAVVADVAQQLAELGVGRVAVALAAELLAMWPHDIGEVLAAVAAGLARSGQQVEAAVLVENTIIDLDQYDPHHGEEAVGLLESLALRLAEAGLPELARQAAGAIPVAEGRQSVLDEMEAVEPMPGPIEDATGEQEEVEETAVGRQPMTAKERADFMTQFNHRLLDGGMPDRIDVYLALREAAGDLAAIDEGETIWSLFETIRAVDRWWGRID